MLLPNKKQLELLIYKLLNDALLVWIVVFVGLVIAEGAIPGFLSAYLSFTKMILALFSILALIAFLGKRNGVVFEFSSSNGLKKNKLVIILLIASFLLIVNSLRNLGIAEIIITSLSAFLILFFFYKTFILPDENNQPR